MLYTYIHDNLYGAFSLCDALFMYYDVMFCNAKRNAESVSLQMAGASSLLEELRGEAPQQPGQSELLRCS